MLTSQSSQIAESSPGRGVAPLPAIVGEDLGSSRRLELGHLLLALLCVSSPGSARTGEIDVGGEIAAADEPLVICSMHSMPASRISARSSGKMPTTSVRHCCCWLR
jgi:hypothetical protein